ncbi:MAG: twin-arginine translocation signal domain-containing protein [Deltaproteobacteria bacterium]|nr:twin-arginine translocation signal domain-containing protein [Deltaproteobacteria bacterium]MBI3387320.1 twin-arginine translocation signal domain-containing protein [Deltaproteobacteria bacterium]
MHTDGFKELADLIGTPLDRRRFLKGSAAGVALLSVGALLPGGCSRYPKLRTPLRFFTAKEYAIVNQTAERLLGVVGGIGAGADQVDVAARLDGWLAAWDADAQQQLRIMLRVFEHGTALFDLQRKRFTMLSDADKDHYLDGWMRSTLGARRVVFRALKALASAGLYPDPTTWTALGYDGPWLGRKDVLAHGENEPVTPLTNLRVPS